VTFQENVGISPSILSTFLTDRWKIKTQIVSNAVHHRRKKFLLWTVKKWTDLCAYGYWIHDQTTFCWLDYCYV